MPRRNPEAPERAPEPPEVADAPAVAPPGDVERQQAARLTRQSLALIAQKKWQQAEGVLEEALSLRPSDPVNLYNLACVRARLGRADAAMESLENAAAAGFTDFVLMGRDPDLNPLRQLPRYKALVARKEEWQRRAAEAVVEALQDRFGDEYLYSVDYDQKLIFATNVDEKTLDELKDVLKVQAQSQQKELFEHKPDAFITVVVPSAKDYHRIVRLRGVGGMYVDGSKTLIAQKLGEVMRHEFTHAMHAADRAPLGQDHAVWVSEGLGVLYESADAKGGGAQGADADGAARLVPRGNNPRYAVAAFAARRRSLIPLERLLKMNSSEFMSRPNLTYPESGALMFYLRERGVLRKFYDAYKATFDADPTGAVALQRATDQTLEEFEAAWKQWLLNRGADIPGRGNSFFLGVRLRRDEGKLTIADVHEGGPAEAAGLMAGDVLVSINDNPVRDYSSIRPAIGAYAPGKTVTVRVLRDGKEVDVALKLARSVRQEGRPEVRPEAESQEGKGP